MATSETNRVGVQAMMRYRGVVEALQQAGERIKAEAEAISPVRTGQYRDGTIEPGGFHVEVHTFGSDGLPFVRVVNTAPHAVFLEYGTRYMAKQRILGRATESARRT